MRLRLGELAERLGVRLHGDESLEIGGLAGIREAEPGDLTCLGNPKYAEFLETTRASAIIMSEVPPGLKLSVLESSQPYAAFVEAMKIFSEDRRDAAPGIHPTAAKPTSARTKTAADAATAASYPMRLPPAGLANACSAAVVPASVTVTATSRTAARPTRIHR